MIGIGSVDKLQPADFDRTRGASSTFLAVAGEIVSALALDLDRRNSAAAPARCVPVKDGRSGTDGARPRVCSSLRAIDTALGVVGVALFTPAHREAIELATVHHEGDGLGRFAERDRQSAGGERIERAGMARALGLEQALHDAHSVRRRHADRLVENDPAVHVVLVALLLFRSLSRRRSDRRDSAFARLTAVG